MERKISYIKILIGGLAAFVLCFAFGTQAFSSLINWEKHSEWRRKKLEETVEQVDHSGTTPILILFIRQYDTNGDGAIDANEVKAIKKFLEDTPAAAPAKPA